MKNILFRYLFILSFLSVSVLLAWTILDRPPIGIDDANIFFVYAKNIGTGHGLVYNIGGERVEGFSSLLWTLLCTLIFYLSTKPELTLLIINIIVLSIGITYSLSYLESVVLPKINHYGKVLWMLILVVLLLTSPAYVTWNTITLMENSIWSTVLLAATILVTSDHISPSKTDLHLAILSVLLLLARPEAFLWVFVFSGILLVRRILVHGTTKALRTTFSSFVVIGITIIVLTVFRISYFGYPLPNTFYAKVSPSLFYDVYKGTSYFVHYFLSNAIVRISIVAVAVAFIHTIISLSTRNFEDKGLLFLPVIAITGLSIPVFTGGDHFGSFRFYQGVYPILVLCLIYCVGRLLPEYIELKGRPHLPWRTKIVFGASVVVIFILGFVIYQVFDWHSFRDKSDMLKEFAIAKEGRKTGQFMAALFSSLTKPPSVGVVSSGGIKYIYPGEVVDLMGLNNLSMAHNGGSRQGMKNHAAFEKVTFYQLSPDIVTPILVSSMDWHYDSTALNEDWVNTVPLKGLYNDSAFLNEYTYAKITVIRMKSTNALVAWFRKDFLLQLGQYSNFMVERYEYLPQN